MTGRIRADQTEAMPRAFRNWAGNQVCLPTAWHEPTSIEAVVDIVASAAAAGRRVKVVGAGHSFTAAACTDGELVSLDRMDRLEAVDRDAGRVTVQAGIRLNALSRALHEHGLALPNLGDIDVQSIAGAISTATHGTGRAWGNLATTVEAIELVDGTGEVVTADRSDQPDLLHAARVSIGALGVITRVTLQCVPAFRLEVTETAESLDDMLDGWEQETASVDHVEFFWLPGTDRALVKRNRRTDEPAAGPGRLSHFRDRILAENVGFGLLNAVAKRVPASVPRLAGLLADGMAEKRFVDDSFRVFASPRWVRFTEMEYGIPLAAVPEAMRRVRRAVEQAAQPLLFPVEVRCSAADDAWLSTAHGRESGWIAVHVAKGQPYDQYFSAVERIMADYDGRPHWGKLHFLSADELASRYPRWSDFAAVRAELDPAGRFANAYLDRVLGTMPGPV